MPNLLNAQTQASGQLSSRRRQARKGKAGRQSSRQTDGRRNKHTKQDADTSRQFKYKTGNETHHLWPSIRRIHSAVIFRRCLTVVVGSSLYFSSSLMGSTLANQNGNSAGSLGGWPCVSSTRCCSQLALLARMRSMKELPISRSSRVGIRLKCASADSGVCAGIPLTVGGETGS
jgi:hypothetical protein